jgi:ABC-type transport system involved in Fe-S cluster assembly fused permease/ATPase subunit
MTNLSNFAFIIPNMDLRYHFFSAQSRVLLSEIRFYKKKYKLYIRNMLLYIAPIFLLFWVVIFYFLLKPKKSDKKE